MSLRSTALFATVLLVCALPAQAQLGFAGPEVEYEAVPESQAFAPGAQARYVLAFALSEGWHVNAHEPLDEFLIPTVLSVDAPKGVAVGEVVYPEHEMYTFSFSEEPLAVYEREFHLGLVLQLGDSLAPGDYELSGSLRYQACNDKQCAPPKTLDITLPLKVAAEAAAGESPEIFATVDWPDAVGGAMETAPGQQPGVAEPGPAAEAPRESPGDWRELADNFEVAAALNG